MRITATGIKVFGWTAFILGLGTAGLGLWLALTDRPWTGLAVWLASGIPIGIGWPVVKRRFAK